MTESNQPSAISTQPKWNLRYFVPEDAPAFAKWTAENPQIPVKDMEAGMKANNPTCTVLVLEEDGVVRFFLPVYFSLTIAYCGFNPENTPQQNKMALEAMLLCLKEFARFWKINEISTLTKSGLPIAEWARSHGFEQEDRELFVLKVNPTQKLPQEQVQ